MATSNSTFGRVLMMLLILAVLLFIFAMPNLHPIRDKAREAETKQNLHAIQLALERYAVDNNGTYPLWLSGGLEVSYSGSGPDFDYIADRLILDGYMPDYPSNPFAKSPESPANKDLFKLQKDLDDPLSYGSSAWIQNMRFGATGKVAMGNVMADPRFAQMPHIDAKGNQGIAGTGTDVIFHCWDLEELDEQQYWLQGQFAYKSLNPLTYTDDPATYDFTSGVANDYFLACYGSERNKGQDVLGVEQALPYVDKSRPSTTFWACTGVEFPGKQGAPGSPVLRVEENSTAIWQYSNPNGIADGICLVLTSETADSKRKGRDQ